MPLQDHPLYAPYFKMLKVGLPPPFVKNKMGAESPSADPDMLDKDPLSLVDQDGGPVSGSGEGKPKKKEGKSDGKKKPSPPKAKEAPKKPQGGRPGLPPPPIKRVGSDDSESEGSGDDWGADSDNEDDKEGAKPAKMARPPTMRVPPPPRPGGNKGSDSGDSEDEWGSNASSADEEDAAPVTRDRRRSAVRISGDIRESLAATLAGGSNKSKMALEESDEDGNSWGSDDDEGAQALKGKASNNKARAISESEEEDEDKGEAGDMFGNAAPDDPYDLFGSGGGPKRAGAGKDKGKDKYSMAADSFSDLFGDVGGSGTGASASQGRNRSNSTESTDSLFSDSSGVPTPGSASNKSRASFSALFDANDDNLFDEVTEVRLFIFLYACMSICMSLFIH